MITLSDLLSHYIPCKLVNDMIKDGVYDHEHEHKWWSMSWIRGYHWIELVEFYLEHYLTQWEHITGRIAGGDTRIRR